MEEHNINPENKAVEEQISASNDTTKIDEKKPENKWIRRLKRLIPGAAVVKFAREHWKLTCIVAAIAIGTAYAITKMVYNTATSFEVVHNERIDITPAEIRSIEEIGEWEFLSVNMEELVDTTKKGFFTGTSTLARIYKGTVRIGIDMHECKDGWLTTQGDTLRASLPAIKVLDKNFIDEANTRSFYEDGSWTGNDKERMYQKAHRMMLQKGFSAQNRKKAEETARQQLTKFFHSFGYNNVELTFGK